MFTLGISLVKNEEDIIERFIRCNLEFLDGIIIFDNLSTDGTRDILNSLMQEGLPVCLSDDNEPGYFQSEKMTNFLHRVGSTFNVDYIFPLDADELIECESREVFRSILSTCPKGSAGLLKWKTYVLTPELAKSQQTIFNPCDFKFHRAKELPPYEKVVIRIDKEKVNELVLANGNHNVISPQVTPLVNLSIPLAHFPLRSKAQSIKRAIYGNMAYLIEDKKKYNKNRDRGFQKKSLYSKIIQGQDFSSIDLSNLSLNYAQIPGELQWPENIIKSDFNWHNVENRYNKLIRGNNILIDIVKSFQEYITGPVDIFDPTNTYSVDCVNNKQESVNLKNTAFEKDWHVNNIHLDIPPFKYIYDRFSPKSIFDIGCGLGKYARLLSNLGVPHAIGVDNIIPDRLFINPENYHLHDLSKSLDLHEKFDLVICCEVAEYLYPGTEDTLLNTIECHSKDLILFSAAAPVQPGLGHINCKPFSFWALNWSDRMWAPELFESFGFRALSTYSWFRRNAVLLSRTKSIAEAKEKWSPLIRISNEDFIYYSIPFEVINNPLTKDIPSDKFGTLMPKFEKEVVPKNDSNSISNDSSQDFNEFSEVKDHDVIRLMRDQIEKQVKEIAALIENIVEITSSKKWRFALWLGQVRVILAPPNSFRLHILLKFYRFIYFQIKTIKTKLKFQKNLSLIKTSNLFNKHWYLANNPDVV